MLTKAYNSRDRAMDESNETKPVVDSDSQMVDPAVGTTVEESAMIDQDQTADQVMNQQYSMYCIDLSGDIEKRASTNSVYNDKGMGYQIT
jgi:hypothetical protein